jgi:hypothetical protein
MHGRRKKGIPNFVGKHGRETPFGIPRHKWEDNPPMGCKEIKLGCVDRLPLAQE